MNKVVDFLEKNVQWVALGLGGLFLLWMVFSYVISAPVVAQVGDEQVAPGEVDRLIKERAAEPLERQMAEGGGVPRTSAGNPVKVIEDNFNRPAAGDLSPMLIASTGATVELKTGPERVDTGALVSELPALPTVAYAAAPRTGLAYAQSNGQPAADPANPADPNAAPAGAEDLAWVMVRYTVPTGQIAQEFNRVGVPPNSPTWFVRAELQRQEKLSSGDYGESVVVPLLETSDVWPIPSDVPGGVAKSPEQRQSAGRYRDWAQTSQGEILQPAYYPVLEGENPMFEAPPEAEGGVGAGFDPANFQGNLRDLNEEQRAAVMTARRAAALERSRQQQQNRPAGGPQGGGQGGEFGGYGGEFGGGAGGGRGGRGGRPNFAPRDPDRLPFLQARPPGPGGYLPEGYGGAEFGGYGGEFGGYDGGYGGFPGASQFGQPGGPQQGPPITGIIPTGPFFPASQPAAEAWLFDNTAEPGKTYRYKVVYRLANPLFDTRNVVDPEHPEIEQTAWLTSPQEAEADWTEDVTVQPLTYFYLANNFGRNAEATQIEVYRRHQGKPSKETFRVSPGDPIGRDESAGGKADYTTGSTLVDLRTDPGGGDPYALVMDPSGRVARRKFEADRGDPKRLELQQAVEREEANAQQAAGTLPPDGVAAR